MPTPEADGMGDEGLAVAGWQVIRSPTEWIHLRDVVTGYGERDLLRRFPLVSAWAEAVRPLAVKALSSSAAVISALWFDKAPETNWRVPWHQDVQAPVAPFTADGWGPWTDKGGVPHVQLPQPWCSRRIAMRLHLDHCTAESGPLEIIPGSHQMGVLSPGGIEAAVAQSSVQSILCAAGDVVLMHPLLLHRSFPARQPLHRRVIHFEWCDVPLPFGESWLDGRL